MKLTTTTIAYTAKATKSTNVYVNIDSTNLAKIKQMLLWCLITNSKNSLSNTKALYDIAHTYWYVGNPSLKKGNQQIGGTNSANSWFGGLMHNLTFASQKDFTDVNLKTIEKILDSMANLVELNWHIPEVQEDYYWLERIVFTTQQPVKTRSVKPKDATPPQELDPDLFG